jgi:manganese/zinc/iron transport system substrate-binding protein
MPLLAVLLWGCGWADGEEVGDQLTVVATTGMIADAAQQIGGDRVWVRALMGPGVDPHGYKASPGDVRRLASAQLVLYNGLHLEAALTEVLEGMSRRRPTVAVTEWLDPAQLLRPPEYGGGSDPHVWFDVSLWRVAAARIAAALAAADPAHAAEYAGRAAAYDAELAGLDEWVRQRLRAVPSERRVLITAHDAFSYFGRAYGFEVMGLQGISTAAEAGTADVQRLARAIATRRIPAIFVETSIPRRTIEAVQAAVGARGFRVEIGPELYSDALGVAGSGADSYAGMVRHNVAAIAGALTAIPE